MPLSSGPASAGSSSSRSACCREPILDEACEPSTRASSVPAALVSRRARANSGRPGRRDNGSASSTITRGNSSGSLWPSRTCRAGQSSCRAVTAAATGLPGSPKNGTPSPMLPKAKGRPGRRNSFQKSTAPSSATSGRIQSVSPAETPPVLTTTSQSWARSSRAWRRASG